MRLSFVIRNFISELKFKKILNVFFLEESIILESYFLNICSWRVKKVLVLQQETKVSY